MELPQLTFRQYQRVQETAKIVKAWKDVQKLNKVQLILVGGKSGTGKSTLLASALEDIIPLSFHGFAKFESGGRSSLPFAPLRQLLGEICRGIILEMEQQDILSNICGRILREGLSPIEQSILISFIPWFGDILREAIDDDDDDSSSTSSDESRSADITKDGLSVLTLALRSFLKIIATIRPVVLFLDDLMWSDETTLLIIQSLLTDETQKSLLFCATYREEDSEYPKLEQWIQFLKSNLPEGHDPHDIHLKDLQLDQVAELLSDSMRGKDAKDLAEIFYHHTHGNLFFMSQLLEDLQSRGLLTFDYGSMQWTWEIEAVKRQTSLSDNVLAVVSARLERLPENCCEILQLASCFGSRFSVEAISASKSVLDINAECITPSLECLVEQDLITKLIDEHYKFSHDTIQLAAYSLLANQQGENLDKLHWSIGLKLMELSRLKEDEFLLFTCVDQLNLGQGSAQTLDDRCKVAQLNLDAGKKAATMSAFLPASDYLRAGIDILGKDPFHPNTCALAIPLHSLYAKTEFCIGHIEESRTIADLVVSNARTASEKESPYLTLIACYFLEDKTYEMVEFCLDRLEDLGEKLPRKPNVVQQQLEHQRIRRLLRGKSDEDLLNLPKMNSEAKSLAIRILCELVMVLHQQGRNALLQVIVGNMLRITLKHGMAHYTAEAFTAIGAYLASKGDIKEGHRFGSIGEILLQRSYHNRKELKGRAYVWISSCTKWWVEPIPLSLDLFIAGNKHCMESGSITFACHCSVLYSAYYFNTGLALEPLLQDVDKYANLMLEYRQSLPFLVLSPLWQCLLNLTGKSKDPTNMQAGKAFEKRRQLPNQDKAGQIVTYSYWMQVSFFHGDIDKADECAQHLKSEATGLTKAMVFYPVRLFFFALVALAKCRQSVVSKLQRRKHKAEAEKHTKTLRGLVEAGAINIVHKVQLLETELLALSLNTATERVSKMYDTAIVSATRAGFLQDAALANYLCFQFCDSRGHVERAEDYLTKSYNLWNDWNAYSVADSLARRHHDVFENSSGVMTSREMIGSSSGGYRSRARFDASVTEQHKQLFL